MLGDTALFIQANAGDVAGQKAVVEAVKSAFGHLDILFVNAGAADFRPIEAFDEEAFDRSVAINVKGPFFLIQALLPVLSNPASIVLNTSINAHIGMPNTSVYALTKAALLSFAKTLSGELIGRGIRVNAVSPGPVATPALRKARHVGRRHRRHGCGQDPGRQIWYAGRNCQGPWFSSPPTNRPIPSAAN